MTILKLNSGFLIGASELQPNLNARKYFFTDLSTIDQAVALVVEQIKVKLNDFLRIGSVTIS